MNELYTTLASTGKPETGIGTIGEDAWESLHTSEVTNPFQYVRDVIAKYKEEI